MTRSLPLLFLLMMPLPGCALVPGLHPLPATITSCPPALAAPPPAAIDALAAAAKIDNATAGWVVLLEKNYQEQDACAGSSNGAQH